MKHFTRSQVLLGSFLTSVLLFLLVGILWTTHFPGDQLNLAHHGSFGALHTIINVIVAFSAGLIAIIASIEWTGPGDTFLYSLYNPQEDENDEAGNGVKLIAKWLKWGIALLILYMLFSFSKNCAMDMKKMYNTSKLYQATITGK